MPYETTGCYELAQTPAKSPLKRASFRAGGAVLASAARRS